MTADGLRSIRGYREREEHRIVGLMTGTSADGVDAALVRFAGLGLESRHQIEAYRESALEPRLRREILDLASAERMVPERLLEVHALLGELYASVVLDLLERAGRTASEVDAVGMHGQTVRHVPRAEGAGQARSLQIGSAAIVAERTGIVVVSDFRSRDTAAGGEGAPMVPLTDWWLFHSKEESRVLLNLGGMANLTHLPRDAGPESALAFDTGPGNSVLDALVELQGAGGRRDEGGLGAARGRASQELLGELLEDPFFSIPPPRSTGRERFGIVYARELRKRGRALGLRDDDLLATAVELTAASIESGVTRFVRPRPIDAVYASGGGVHNPTLMEAIARRLAPVPLGTIATLGVSDDGKEALAFAFLAHQTLCGEPGNLPGATGARRPVVLGSITPGGL